MSENNRTKRPWIVVVGGFLGAGKTTLLMAAAEELERRGLRSAIILNDQGKALVDTQYASLRGIDRGEVTGGCFCCRFSDLMSVMDRLRAHAPDVIFAEPVGSCTDISATMLQPLREYSDGYRLAPFTVLVDPLRALELMDENADPNLRFLFLNQLEEADIVCYTKSDISPQTPSTDAQTVRQLSAKTGKGVTAWLDEVLSGTLSVATKILTIDYAEYARAEAALAWLNLQVAIELPEPRSGPAILGPLLEKLDADFTQAGISIVHLKAILQSTEGYLKASICANGQPPSVEGALDASPAIWHELLINLRAVGDADQVRGVVEKNIQQIHGALIELRIACFHPAPPKPERRITAISNTIKRN
jgi:KaiC/GvpD/RAD55 family RecA-like ATPase